MTSRSVQEAVLSAPAKKKTITTTQLRAAIKLFTEAVQAGKVKYTDGEGRTVTMSGSLTPNNYSIIK